MANYHHETPEQRAAAKKAAYRRDLDEELRLKKERERREREDAILLDSVPEADPWGRDGSGAPNRDLRGNVVADIRGSDLHAANQAQNLTERSTADVRRGTSGGDGGVNDDDANSRVMPPPTKVATIIKKHAWETIVADKIFQKGGDGASGIARYLQRYVRYSDHTPHGAILNSDFRRVIAELNVAVDESSYAAVAASCAFEAEEAHPGGALLSVRSLAFRLADVAAKNGGISSIHAPVEPSPLTGTSIPRVTLEVHHRARERGAWGGPNDPDYDPPERGRPQPGGALASPAPPARSDPHSLMYDHNPCNYADADEDPAVGGLAATTPYGIKGNGVYDGEVTRGEDGDYGGGSRLGGRGEPHHHHHRPHHRPREERPYADEATKHTPGRVRLAAWEETRAEDAAAGRVANVGVPPVTQLPFEHDPPPMPTLRHPDQVEEAVRAQLIARTTGGRDVVGRAMRILSGASYAGGRAATTGYGARAGGQDIGITLEQFRVALLRLNINPADPRVVEEVFRRHDRDGSGTLDHAEFVRYLLPQDFEPTSPREYRKNYRGYTPKVGELVEGGQSGADGRAGAGTATARDAAAAAAGTSAANIFHHHHHGGGGGGGEGGGEGGSSSSIGIGPAGKAVPRPGYGASRGVQRPVMAQQSPMQGRDARMHGLLPDDSGAGRSGGASGYRASLYETNEAGGEHNLTVRRIELAVLTKLSSSNGGDATPADAYRLFRYFDDDREGFITAANLRAALRRLNVDPTDAAFAAFVARYDPDNTGLIAYGPLSKALVPERGTADAMAAAGTAAGGKGQRWGADGGDRWAGYDRSRIAGTLENLNQPSFFDKVPGEEGYVPWVKTVEEVERLLAEKVLERGTNQRAPRDMWKYFDRDGSGAVSRVEFETALSYFNISAAPDVITAFMRKYDTDNSGEMDYMELLACLAPETAAGGGGGGASSRNNNNNNNFAGDTVSYIKRLDINETAAGGGVAGRGGAGAARGGGRGGRVGPTSRPDLVMEYAEPSLTLAAAREAEYDEGRQQMSVKQFQHKLLDWMSVRGNGLVALRKLFKFLDADNSGYVTYEEFGKAIMRLNIHPRHEDLRRIVAHYDSDGDGYIEFNEFVNNVLPEHDHPGYEANNWQSIAHHDPKPPNIMPFSHMLYVTQMEKLILDKVREKSDGQGSARNIFRELDWDHSGTVSPEEFRRWLRRLNFFPDEETFDRLWRTYDPQGKGFIAYQDFVDRVAPKPNSRTSVI